MPTEREVNEALARWVWPDRPVECLLKHILVWLSEYDVIYCGLFTESLDSLNTHIWPKLREQGIDLSVRLDDEGCYCRLWHQRKQKCVGETSHESEAMARSLAVCEYVKEGKDVAD